MTCREQSLHEREGLLWQRQDDVWRNEHARWEMERARWDAREASLQAHISELQKQLSELSRHSPTIASNSQPGQAAAASQSLAQAAASPPHAPSSASSVASPETPKLSERVATANNGAEPHKSPPTDSVLDQASQFLPQESTFQPPSREEFAPLQVRCYSSQALHEEGSSCKEKASPSLCVISFL